MTTPAINQPNWAIYREVMDLIRFASTPTIGCALAATASANKIANALDQAAAAGADIGPAKDIITKGMQAGGRSGEGYTALSLTEKQSKCVAIILAKSGLTELA